MQTKKQYTLTKGKLKRAYRVGFDLLDNGVLQTNAEAQHVVVLKKFRSFEEGSRWGRLSFKADISPESLLIVRAFARDGAVMDMAHKNKAIWDNQPQEVDEEIEKLEQKLLSYEEATGEKRQIFEAYDALRLGNTTDMLLYDLVGEYLFISFEVMGDGPVSISDIKLDTQGDNFMQTFPEIYQEEAGFFHRYMSIFSSIYNDFQVQIDQIPDYLDFDTIPYEFLPVLADWLGFKVDQGFLDEKTLRSLLKEIYALNRIKGTKKALKRIVNLIAGCEPVIIERNRMDGYIDKENVKVFRNLYGENPHDITILLNIPEDEKLYAKLKYLLNLFKPTRSTLHLAFIENSDRMDAYCYLDLNASLVLFEKGRLDKETRFNGRYCME